VSAYDGLRALTINGAFQYHEEATKGSLEVGKLADLVVLSANPVKVNPQTIKDIQVVETIKEGRSIYRRPADVGATSAAPSSAAPVNDKDNCLVPHPGQRDKPLSPAQRSTLERLMAPAGTR
jgi:urease alpha subunit